MAGGNVVSDHNLFLLHARLPAFARKVAQAERSISEALAVMQRPYVSFSGGKDSSVLLHLVRCQAPECPAILSDDEWLLPETEALIAATPNLIRVARPLEHAAWFTAWEHGRSATLPDSAEWVDGSRWQWARDERGHDGVFLGLRADENARRRLYLRRFGPAHFSATHQMWHINPLAWWSVRDVWAYLHSREVPHNAAYDVLTRLGVPREQQRVGPLAVERVLGYGQLAILKRGWPALWNRFVAAYPEASAYV